MEKSEIAAIIASLGLTVNATFVPFSKSRHKGEATPTLNWAITIQCKGRDVMTTDYSAGVGHVPGYRHHNSAGTKFDRQRNEGEARQACETGFPMKYQEYSNMNLDDARGFVKASLSKAIMPDDLNVMHSLIMDSGVLDSGGFEEWASEYGYDTDSRAAEATYRACLEIGLKLRAAIGDSGLGLLRDAFQDY